MHCRYDYGSCFWFTLPDEEIENAYILFALTNGNTTISCRSGNFRIIQFSSHQSCKTCRKSFLLVMIWVVSTISCEENIDKINDVKITRLFAKPNLHFCR